MFKWRSDKIRITAVFKLQFHATQVSEHGLVISVVPAENGKPTAKLEKSTLKDKACYWDNPIYETVKFFQDPKTSKIQEKIYYFLICNGSPRGSLVGECSVNIADYIETTKPCSISFPFKNYISESYFHVTIQRIQENNNFSRVQSDFEEKQGLRFKQDDDKSLRWLFSNDDVEHETRLNSVEDQILRKNASHSVGLNGTRRVWNGSDITLSSSDSSSGLNTPQEPGVRNGNIHKDQTPNSSGYQEQQKEWDLAIVPINDSSTEYSMNSPRDFFPSSRSPMGLDYSVDKLRAEVVAASRRAEVSELELQTLRKQIVKESKKGQDLLREISILQEEKNILKVECEKLKTYRKRSEELNVKSKFQFEGDPWTLIEVITEELNHEKEMNANLTVQLQKTQYSNEELIIAVQDLEEMLKKNSKGVTPVPNRSISGESAVEIEESILKCQSDDDEAQKALEDLVRQHSDVQGTYILEQKIMDLCSEIEMYRRDKDELEMQIEQLALDYEILKQENHELATRLEQIHLQEQLKIQCDGSSTNATIREHEAQRLKLENELKEKAEEFSCCLAEIKDLKACNKVLEVDMKTLRSDKMDQEERAAQAEVTLNESNAIINELETLITKLKKERKMNLEELSSSLTSITKLETHNRILEEQLEKQTQIYEADMDTLAHEKMELEGQIKELENALKERSEESANQLATVKELEAHIRTLEEDLEKQVEGFEAELEPVTRAKVDQEQRAIRAEESLRLVKWKNANTAVRIQDEFKRLSSQMQTSFEANEKLASKTSIEASGLRMHNCHLLALLQKDQEELQSTKDEYETKLKILYHEINTMSSQIEQMEPQRENTICDSSMKEMEGKSFEELSFLRNLKDEEEQAVSKLKSEVEELTTQCDNFKNSVYEDELEKEKLRKQVFKLEADLKNKDEAILSIEKKFEENSGKIIVQEKASSKSECSSKDIGSKEVVTLKEWVKLLEEKVSVGTQVVGDMPEEAIIKISNVESNSNIEADSQPKPSDTDYEHQRSIDVLLKEMDVLKEKNNSMEIEQVYAGENSEISLKLAEVEGERQNLLTKAQP